MSKYTTEVRFICEQAAGLSNSGGYSSIKDTINAAIPKIFDFDFPVFNPSYKNVLCYKILSAYYTREICEETVGLWKLRLDNKLNMIMPYYNKLYELEEMKINPLIDVDYTVSHSGSGTQRKNGNTDTVVKADSSGSSSADSSKNTDSSDTKNSTSTLSGGQSMSSSGESTQNSTSTHSDHVTSKGTNSKTEDGTVEQTESSSKDGTRTINKDSSASSSLTSDSTGKTTNSSTETITNSQSENSSYDDTDKFSDTPQGSLQNVVSGTYLTNARIKNNTAEKTLTGSSTKELSGEVNSTDHKTDISTSSEDEKVTETFTEAVAGKNDRSENRVTSGEESSHSDSDGESSSHTTGSTSSSEKIIKNEENKEIYSGLLQSTTTENSSLKSTQNTNSTTNVSASDNATSTDEYLNRTYGKMGTVSYAKLIMEYRESLINIDQMILNDLRELFFTLW